MRILYITSVLNRGGAEQQLYYLLKYLRPQPDVTVVSLGGTGHWEQAIKDLGVRVIPLKRKSKGDLSRLFELMQIIRSGHYDIVHLWIDNVPGIYAHLAMFAVGHPRFITGERADIYSQPGWYRRFKRVANRRVKRVLCNSNATARNVIHERLASASQVDYIPNGIELDRFTPKPTPSDTITVGMVGSLSAVKNPEMFVRAAAKVIEIQPSVRFMHVGDGAMMDDMRQLARDLEIADSLTFYGLREDIPKLLQQMDVFVLTSNSEGTPNAVMEAMAASLPCVTTNVGDCSGLITDGENGYLVPVGDIDQLAAVLLKLTKDASLRRRMGQNSCERIQAYDVHRMAERYQVIYADVLK